MSELKPCWRCDGEAGIGTSRLRGRGQVIETRYTVNCIECGASTGMIGYETKADAVEAWNARPREDALLAVYRAAKALLDADAANKQNAFGKAWRAMREAVAEVERERSSL